MWNRLILFSIFFTLLSVLLLPSTVVHANSNDFFHFESITTENGLSHNMVVAVMQDHYGYMWFGTTSGLNKYDGLHFTIFQKSNDAGSISDSEIIIIYETDDYQMWIGTRKGLNYLDRSKNEFVSYLNNPTDTKSISDNTIWTIYKDSQSILWIGTSNGLNIFNSETKTFSYYKNETNNSASISDNFITKIYEDSYGNLWIGTSDGLNTFNRETNEFKRYKRDVNNPDSISDNRITDIYEDNYGNLWVGTSGGLNLFNPDKRTFISYKHELHNTSSISDNYITSISEDKNGYLWIGTRSGLNRLDPRQGDFQNYGSTQISQRGLNSDYINALFIDNQTNLWIGSAYGINVLNFSQQSFIYYPDINGAIMNICSLDNKILWLKLRHDIFAVDSESHTIINHWTDVFTDQVFSHPWMSTFCIDKKGNLWAGTENSGLQKFDPVTDNFQIFKYEDGKEGTLPSNTILSLCSSYDSDVWVGTDRGLYSYNSTSGKFEKHQDNSPYYHDIMNGLIELIYEMPNSDLWLSTEVGLYKIDYLTGETTRVINYVELEGNLYNNIVRYVYNDDISNILWLVTGYGIYCYDLVEGTLQSCGKASSVSADEITQNLVQGQRDILKDVNGNIWISTSSRSLWKISDNGNIYQYQRRDGLLFEAYSFRASWKTATGELFFGSISGLVSFVPDNLKKNDYLPSVVISNFRTLGKPISMDEPIEDIKQIILPYSNNNFEISFSALDYNNPIGVQYGYILEGFENDWSYTQAFNNSTRYTHLPNGTYTFRIKVSSDNITWNDTGIALTIIIKAAFWQEWWFISTIIAIGIGLVIFFIFYRTRILGRRARQLEVQVEQRTKQLSEKSQQLELELKRRLEYTRMLVHELKSPLTSLQIANDILSETAIENPYNEIAANISNSVGNLEKKINGLLDIAKGELGLFKLNYINTDLNDLFKKLKNELGRTASEKRLKLEFNVPQDLPLARIDSEKFSQVVWNLVDNAMKFTSQDGLVSIDVRTVADKQLIVSVTDNGYGMSEEKQNNIFKPLINNPNDRSDTQRLSGLGIGLILSKMIIDLHGGDIKVESRLGIGSTFTFSIPLNSDGKTSKQEQEGKIESIDN